MNYDPFYDAPVPIPLWEFIYNGIHGGLPEYGNWATDDAESLWKLCIADLKKHGWILIPEEEQYY